MIEFFLILSLICFVLGSLRVYALYSILRKKEKLDSIVLIDVALFGFFLLFLSLFMFFECFLEKELFINKYVLYIMLILAVTGVILLIIKKLRGRG